MTQICLAVAHTITAPWTVEATAMAIRRVFEGFTLMPSEGGSHLVPRIRPEAFRSGTVDHDGAVTLTLDAFRSTAKITDDHSFVT